MALAAEMTKLAQFSTYSDNLKGVTLGDLLREIRKDTNIGALQRDQLISQIRTMTHNASDSSSLLNLIPLIGGVVGYLISRYFGMGSAGRTVSGLLGYGIGSVLDNEFAKQKNPFPGWKLLDEVS